MAELADIKSYVNKMARLISMVVEMDVTICDTHLQMVGDWSCEKSISEEGDYLRSDSVIVTAMRQEKVLIYNNAKEESPGCRKCRKRDFCETETIIAYPIARQGAIIGGIGIYSGEKRQKDKLISETDTMVEFLKSIIDLMINQLELEEERLEILSKANQALAPAKNGSFDQIIGNSSSLSQVKEDARIFAQSYSNILIQGESGTGKEVFALAIHSASRCAEGPFVAVNCAAIPDNLLESELFGYVEGAFTGAIKGGRAGKFELANGGTLFLDEIGELPIHLQPKLLRALQEKKIQRIGSGKPVKLDVRIIAATNRDLSEMIETGEFREDLYYRLSVIPLRIPPLRERREDIRIIAEHFLDMYKTMLEKPWITGFEEDVMVLMESYDWPGNVRELQNAIEYAANRCKGKSIQMEDMKGRIQKRGKKFVPITLKELERETILAAVSYYGNTPEGKEMAAQAIGISRATMYRKLKEYDTF